MITKAVAGVAAVLLAASPGVEAQTVGQTVHENRSITFTDCVLRTPGTALSARAECGSLVVPENPGAAGPGARTITLNIARIPARDPEPRPDPVFFFAGGPGQAATEAWPMLAGALQAVNKRRAILLVDQRGTGGSGKLQCDLGEAEFVVEIDLEEVRQLTRECLADTSADPRFYTTSIAVTDIEAVRRALGLGRINLLGVSYGTRAAQVYLRKYPDQVRSMVLDGVAPPQVLLGSEHAPVLDQVLAKIFARCRDDRACQQRFGDPAVILGELRRRLDETQPVLTLRMPASGEPETVTVTPDVLAVAVRLLSYASETQALLPIVLEQADLGDWQPLASQALMQVGNLTDIIARGMEMSVICSEDARFYPADLDHSHTLLGNTMLDVIRAQCGIWPAGDVPPDFHEPAPNGDVPVLLLSGAYDPVTPPEYAELARQQFARSAHWVVPGRGHGVLRHGCLPDKVAEFLENPSLLGLDSDCVQDIEASPFFLRMTGPLP